jgi:hypothetical protein
VNSSLQPGALVVRRVRFRPNADVIGIVVGHKLGRWEECLVMWTTGDQRVEFGWHLTDALISIDQVTGAGLRSRCGPSF